MDGSAARHEVENPAQGGDDADAVWVAGLRRRDPEVLGRIFEAHRRRLFGYLLRMCGSRALAEDLAQECWVKVARAGHALQPGTRLVPWLFTVARNTYLSHRRRRLLDASSWGEIALWLAGQREERSPEHAAATAEGARRAEQALLRLSPGDRELILLVSVEGLSPAEAAPIVGLKAEAVRQRLHRARARLAALLPEGPV